MEAMSVGFKAFAVSAVLSFACVCAARAEKREIFSLEFPVSVGGVVSAVRPDGEVFELGKVLSVPSRSKYPAFTASGWAGDCTVAATAVNAVHITVSVKDGKGRIISVLPSETIAPAADTEAAFVVDCPAGRGVFGAWAPIASNDVRVRRADGSMRVISADALPREGETMVIKVCEDSDAPYMIDIENKVGGRVMMYRKLSRKTFATVEQPVSGTGRFQGSMYQRRSAVRANHHGVLCVSTSETGEIGGFQIIPYEHSFSPEMLSAWGSPQWMIVKSLDGEPMTARFPLFSGVFTPGGAPREKLWDFWSSFGRRSLVLCRMNGSKKWQRIDEAVGKDNTALEGITHLRIYTPFTSEPLSKAFLPKKKSGD